MTLTTFLQEEQKKMLQAHGNSDTFLNVETALEWLTAHDQRVLEKVKISIAKIPKVEFTIKDVLEALSLTTE